MATSMFYLGIILVILCALSMSPAFLLYFKTRKPFHLYLFLLLCSYLIELIELLYVAHYCLPSDLQNCNLINFPVLRIFTTVSIMLLDLLILLHIMNLKFHKGYLLLFAALALFCAYIAWLPQTLMTVWLFYTPRQIFRFGYCLFFLIRLFLEKNTVIRKRMEQCSFLMLGVFLLNCSILLEDSMLISHIETFLHDMLSITERNFSENILWTFICIYIMAYCIHELNSYIPEPVQPTVQPDLTNTINYSSKPTLLDSLPAIADYYKFTPRETQLLSCLLQYKTTAEICEELHISTGTVKTHTHNIYMKVNANSKSELIRTLTEFSNQTDQTMK